jgi:muconolactone delta-isomerase
MAGFDRMRDGFFDERPRWSDLTEQPLCETCGRLIGRMQMLFFVNVRVDPKDLSFDEMWDVWEKETEAAIAARGSGKIVNLWKVAGQRRVLAVVDVASHDEMDQIFMGGIAIGAQSGVRANSALTRIRSICG